MRYRGSHPIRNGWHKLLKGGAVLLGIVLLYRGMLWTLPLFSKQLKTITVMSAGLSFIDGGMVLAEQEIAQFQAEDGDFYPSHAAQEDQLSDTLSSEEAAPVSSEAETASSPTASSTEETPEAEAPPRPENAGDVIRQTLTAGNSEQFVALSSGSVKNLSYLSNEEVVSLSEAALPFALEDTSEPQVLIYHTHATESYQPYYCDWYDLAYNARNTDNAQNMVAVGDVLAQKLTEAGIGVIHDSTQHDNPSYTGAYDRSRETIQKYLDQYPSIKVILDIHRDALQGDNVITAPATEIGGKKTAQLMMICCADDGSGELPNFKNNLTFACALQKQMESTYPTLTRPILFDERSYNQDMAPGALLVEVGGHGNTLNEAKNAIALFADSLIQVLK